MNWILNLWCRQFHDKPINLMHGKYTCLLCQREFRCDWEIQSKMLNQETAAPRGTIVGTSRETPSEAVGGGSL